MDYLIEFKTEQLLC